MDWEQTEVLSGEIGTYAVVARQRRGGEDWWLGGVTDGDRRQVEVDFSFLDSGRRYVAEIWRDGPDGGIAGDRFAMVREKTAVDADSKLSIVMEAGGGFAMSVRPAN